MKKLLLDIVNSIVDNPEKVKLEESTDAEGTINFTLTVAPEDMGKIIGKEGRVIKSIRNIIRIPAIKQNKRVNLELTEQEKLVKEDTQETEKREEVQAPSEGQEEAREGVEEETQAPESKKEETKKEEKKEPEEELS